MASVPVQYENEILYAANQNGVPASLLAATLNQESGFNPNALSSAGAVGIAQFLPSTAATLGVNPNDPNQSIYGMAEYLSSAFQKYQSWPVALAAYNAGFGAVDKYGGIPPYVETQNYVKAILANQPNYRYLDSANATGGSNSSPFENVLNAAESAAGGLGNNVLDILSGGLLGKGPIPNPFSQVSNLESNINALAVGIMLFLLGAGLIIFAFGEDIVTAVGKAQKAVGPLAEVIGA